MLGAHHLESMYTVQIIFVLWVYFGVAEASIGDRSGDFRQCVTSCEKERCRSSSGPREPWLRLLAWSCQENCRYDCMHSVTAEDLRLGRPVRQFYGKWPFVRFYGIQEPASCLFSLLNGVSVLVAYTRYSYTAPTTYHASFAVRCQFWVNMNAWFWSTIFHARDFPLTEKLDYFGAAALIVAGLLTQFVRISGSSAKLWHGAYTLVWLLLYLAHVAYLSLYRFDYGYNMAASVAAGTLYTAIWLFWCAKNYHRLFYAWKCAVVVIATSCFLLLELLDFPPFLWIFDAHSLWHLSTIPLPLLWYSFLADDAKLESQVKLRKQV